MQFIIKKKKKNNVSTYGVEVKEKKNICALAYDYALSKLSLSNGLHSSHKILIISQCHTSHN